MMSGKKRKRAEDVVEQQPQKKAAYETQTDTIRVSVLQDERTWMPVLASTPGLSLPSDASFSPYRKTGSHFPQLLLHSNAHPMLDYTAHEEASNGSDGHLKHYIGLFDPRKGKLQLVPAQKMVVRSSLKSTRPSLSADSEEEDKPLNKLSARNALGLAFGTRKSQKAISCLTANEISSSQPTSKSSPSKDALDPIAQAVISSMPVALTASSREALEAAMDEAKPRPKPNLQATTPAEVYTIEQLVGGDNVLSKVAVKEWIDRINSGGDVTMKSPYVSKRLVKVVEAGDVKMVRVLKYIYLLIEWWKALQHNPREGKRVRKAEDKEMAPLIEAWGRDLVLGLSKRFAENGMLNKWRQDYFATHLLALTLIVDDFSVDTAHIQYDLKLDVKPITKLYQELGCVVHAPTKAEQNKMRITRAEAQTRRIAVLKIPLVFPKLRNPDNRRGK
ncbi:MAG: hypothetical protein Q9163_002596 [Psora crenata]